MKIKSMIPIFALFGIFILAMHCGNSQVVETPENRIPVKLAPVQVKDVVLPIHGSGMLFSKQQIRLSFKTGGIIKKLHVREGENVRQGQVLAELYPDEIQAQVQQAESALDKALRDYERVSALFADSVTTLEQKQNVETQLSVARSNVQIAKFNLEYSTIKAPANGKILKRFAEESELVGPGTPVFYFGSGTQDWIVRVGVADRDLVQLGLGDSAKVRFDAYPNKIFNGSVREIAQAADPQNGTFEVEVLVDAMGKQMAAGFVARVSLFPHTQKPAMLVPVAAIVEAHDDRATVFTVEDGKAVNRTVCIGAILGDEIIVTKGLDTVENIVTVGSEYLKAGDSVSIQ